jgi:hypothetical protein
MGVRRLPLLFFFFELFVCVCVFDSPTVATRSLSLQDSQPKRRKIFDIPDEINPISPWTEFETELRTTKRSGEEFLQHLNRVFERSGTSTSLLYFPAFVAVWSSFITKRDLKFFF